MSGNPGQGDVTYFQLMTNREGYKKRVRTSTDRAPILSTSKDCQGNKKPKAKSSFTEFRARITRQ
jgi:hypothetical protein